MVITMAVSSAFLLSGVLAYHYGPSGRYLAHNTLLAPNLITKLDYNDTNPKTGGSSRFVFEDILFSFYDSAAKQKRVLHISPEQYAQFYKLITNDKSLENAPQDVITSFYTEKIASLIIKVRTESHAAWQDETKTFQQVDFVPEGDLYRIELHEEKSAPDFWVYFNHPDIYRKVLNTFMK